MAPAEKGHGTYAILFSNGWEVQLCLRNLQVVVAQPLLPVAAAPVVLALPQSA